MKRNVIIIALLLTFVLIASTTIYILWQKSTSEPLDSSTSLPAPTTSTSQSSLTPSPIATKNENDGILYDRNFSDTKTPTPDPTK